MKINKLKITITQGDSFVIPFLLVAGSESPIAKFEPEDRIIFVLQRYGEDCDLLKKEVTGIDGYEFSVEVSKEESAKLCCGRYEYGVYVENGNNRLTLIKPTDFNIERGV